MSDRGRSPSVANPHTSGTAAVSQVRLYSAPGVYGSSPVLSARSIRSNGDGASHTALAPGGRYPMLLGGPSPPPPPLHKQSPVTQLQASFGAVPSSRIPLLGVPPTGQLVGPVSAAGTPRGASMPPMQHHRSSGQSEKSRARCTHSSGSKVL